MKLQLKHPVKMTIKHPKLGELKFDSDIANPSEYEFYYNNGFKDLFEIVVDKVIDAVVEKIEEKIEDFIEKHKKPEIYKGIENKK